MNDAIAVFRMLKQGRLRNFQLKPVRHKTALLQSVSDDVGQPGFAKLAGRKVYGYAFAIRPAGYFCTCPPQGESPHLMDKSGLLCQRNIHGRRCAAPDGVVMAEWKKLHYNIRGFTCAVE